MTDELWEEVGKIDGWLFREEAELLDQLNTGTWCELGSWNGRSTVVLAQRNRGYAIDWFQGINDPDYDYQGVDTYDSFTRNIRPYRDKVAIIPMRFQDAVSLVKPPIHLLFLDAEHSYEQTKEAWELYSPLVAVGGHVVFHDVINVFPGVLKVVGEVMKDKSWQRTETAKRCASFRKVK